MVMAEQSLPVEVGVCLHAVPVGIGLATSAEHTLQIGAGTEGPAGASEDGASHVVVFVYLGPSVRHAHEHGCAQGVSRLRPVHGDNNHRTIALHDQMLRAAHQAPLGSSGRAVEHISFTASK